MSGSLPKVKRVDGRKPGYLFAILGGVIALLVVVIVLMLNGNIFSNEPQSDAERDYVLLLEGLKKNPNNPALLMTLAEAEYDLGRTNDAFDHAEKAVKFAKAEAGIQLRYAQLLVRDGELAKAAAAAQKEIKIAGDSSAEPYFLLAQIQADQKKYDDAVGNMKKGLGLAPQAADMRVVYAAMLEKSGKTEDAIKQYQEALRFLPGDRDAVTALKRLGAKVPTETASPHAQ